jgi:hypothetical protein
MARLTFKHPRPARAGARKDSGPRAWKVWPKEGVTIDPKALARFENLKDSDGDVLVEAMTGVEARTLVQGWTAVPATALRAQGST